MRTVFRIGLACLGTTLALAALPAFGQEEKPVSIDSAPDGISLSLFDEDPAHRLIITGFGVGTFDYNFDTDTNSFGDSALAIAFAKVISDHFSVFGQLTASREPDSSFLGGETASGVETDIDNLQVTWYPSAKSSLAITLGKFDSPLAIERDDAPLNFQASHSFTFDFARPVKFTGLEIYKAFTPAFEGWVMLVNGWDVSADNNKGKTGAVYGLWSPSLAAHVGMGVIYGPEKDDRSSDARTTAVGTLLFQPMEKWVWGGEGVFGSEPHSAEGGGTAEWYAAMLFTHHRLGRHWALTVRGDYLDDRDGSRTGTRQILESFTLSPQYLVGGSFYGIFHYLERTSLRLPEVDVRLDLKFDHSTERVFATRVPDEGKRDHFSAALQTVFLF